MSAAIPTDETLVIETPERVPLHFALASIGNRFLACAFDHALQLFVMAAVAFLFLWLGRRVGEWYERLADAPNWVWAVLIFALFAVWSGYFVFFEWVWNGQTPGKRWLRLRVIREDGRPVTFWEAAARNVLRIFDMMPFPFYSVGLVSVFVSRRDQRVGDMVAGTVVVREREAQAPTFEQVFDAPTSDPALRRSYRPVAFTCDLTGVGEREIEVVESFLRRRWDLPDAARAWMAWRVALPLLQRLQPNINPADFSYEGFLEELLHRYRAAHRFRD
jgi:uncharacterized RDD family membrane protein YckC